MSVALKYIAWIQKLFSNVIKFNNSREMGWCCWVMLAILHELWHIWDAQRNHHQNMLSEGLVVRVNERVESFQYLISIDFSTSTKSGFVPDDKHKWQWLLWTPKIFMTNKTANMSTFASRYTFHGQFSPYVEMSGTFSTFENLRFIRLSVDVWNQFIRDKHRWNEM